MSTNPYHPGAAEQFPSIAHRSRTPFVWLISLLIAYYAFSSLTLPFADKFWFGELPPFAIPQLPKSWGCHFVRQRLIQLTMHLGIDKGSASPNSIAMQPWAFGIVFVTPTIALLGFLAACQRIKDCRRWILALLAAAVIDAMVTVWFDKTSRLSIF